jgi:nicotinate-nucleotide pyrophosphorylase (carboxylating)
LAFSEKRAVVVGGVLTHRLGLFDGFLIKDNHLALIAREFFGDRVDINEDLKVKAVEEALRMVKKYRDEHEVLASLFVEVEVESLAQAVAAAEMYRSERVPDMVLLDNMSPAMVAKCVEAIRCVAGPGVLVEASGGVTPENLASYLGSGVDVASMSFLTLDARPLDIAMKIVGYK